MVRAHECSRDRVSPSDRLRWLTVSTREQAPSKTSHLSRRINEEIKLVAAFMGVVCLVGAMLSTIWSSQVGDFSDTSPSPASLPFCVSDQAHSCPPLYHLLAVVSASLREKFVSPPALSNCIAYKAHDCVIW